MCIQNDFELPLGIKENIFKYKFEGLLKQYGKPYSGKLSVYERLKHAVEDPEFLIAFEQFVVDEISNGRNRQVFICNFSIESLAVLGNYDAIQARLSAKKLPVNNFNSLLDPSISTQDTLVYLDINRAGKHVKKISMAFLNESLVQDNGEGGPTDKNVVNYVWIDIFPENKYLQIKIRPYSNNSMINFQTSQRVFDYYWNLIKNIFGVVYTNMIETKGTLYTIFKVLTDKAEGPYAKKVNEKIIEIENKVNELATSIGLANAKQPVDIPVRVARLFERALILNDLVNYKAYDKEKLGIVDKIAFSDQSGAKVSAFSGDDGIEVADIYFDTRETLDELKQLNRLWVRWFLPVPVNDISVDESQDKDIETISERKINQIETRLEVYESRVIIQFLNVYTAPKEVQDYVLSLFRKFEEGEIS